MDTPTRGADPDVTVGGVSLGVSGPETTKPPEIRGFRSVDLVDLYSKNSDGTQVTPEQQRSWVEKSSSSRTSGPIPTHRPHAVSRRIGADATAEIIHRYSQGETAKALAEEFGIARNSVLNLLRENNVVVRRQPPTLEQQAQLAAEYEAGATIADLVTRHGHSYGAVRRVLKEAGVQMRPRGGSCERRY